MPGTKLNLHASQLLPHIGPPFIDLELSASASSC